MRPHVIKNEDEWGYDPSIPSSVLDGADRAEFCVRCPVVFFDGAMLGGLPADGDDDGPLAEFCVLTSTPEWHQSVHRLRASAYRGIRYYL